MAARNLLHKNRFQEFLTWCEVEKGLATRPGMGDYQLGQVQAKGSGQKSGQWHTFFYRIHMPEHVTVPEAMIPLVSNFIRSTRKETQHDPR